MTDARRSKSKKCIGEKYVKGPFDHVIKDNHSNRNDKLRYNKEYENSTPNSNTAVLDDETRQLDTTHALHEDTRNNQTLGRKKRKEHVPAYLSRRAPEDIFTSSHASSKHEKKPNMYSDFYDSTNDHTKPQSPVIYKRYKSEIGDHTPNQTHSDGSEGNTTRREIGDDLRHTQSISISRNDGLLEPNVHTPDKDNRYITRCHNLETPDGENPYDTGFRIPRFTDKDITTASPVTTDSPNGNEEDPPSIIPQPAIEVEDSEHTLTEDIWAAPEENEATGPHVDHQKQDEAERNLYTELEAKDDPAESKQDDGNKGHNNLDESLNQIDVAAINDYMAQSPPQTIHPQNYGMMYDPRYMYYGYYPPYYSAPSMYWSQEAVPIHASSINVTNATTVQEKEVPAEPQKVDTVNADSNRSRQQGPSLPKVKKPCAKDKARINQQQVTNQQQVMSQQQVTDGATRVDYVSQIHTLVQLGKLRNVTFKFEELKQNKALLEWRCEVVGEKTPFSGSKCSLRGDGAGRSQKLAKQSASQNFLQLLRT